MILPPFLFLQYIPKTAVRRIALFIAWFAVWTFSFCSVLGQANNEATALQRIDSYNVVWNTPSLNSKGSMPLGNGDIGLNVWVEKNGDLLFYVAKSDAWSEEPASYRNFEALIKLGRVRVHFDSNPFAGGKPFVQTLRLREGAIDIRAGEQTIRVWVDANHPVVYVESDAPKADRITVRFESLRTPELLARRDKSAKNINAKLHSDRVFSDLPDRVAWVYENNAPSTVEKLVNLKFGAIMLGTDLVRQDSVTLVSRRPARKQTVALFVHSANVPTADDWLTQTSKLITPLNDITKAKKAHDSWWKAFWQRSWIFVDGDADAETVSRAYNLQRFVTACAGRGAHPIHFNGSLFNVDDTITFPTPEKKTLTVAVNADYRYWGPNYWFQNTRHMYYPLLASGDFDLMQPFFRMYQEQVTLIKKGMERYYGPDAGIVMFESMSFWGEVQKSQSDNNAPGNYLAHYFTPTLELSHLMLDYYAVTGDRNFLRNTLLPYASNAVLFFTKRFQKDASGRLNFEPANSAETYWKAKNPLPDVVGYRVILQRLLTLPNEVITPEQKRQWTAFLDMAPPVPLGTKNGLPVILAAEKTDSVRHNIENPELYSVFPFRYYGLGKPDLERARNTFDQRIEKRIGCWHNDLISAALLGKTAEAKDELVKISDKSYARVHGRNKFRFPAFWGPGHDYSPDQDHGGVLMMALQTMLLQEQNGQPALFPAWPKEWNVSFKLHAPGQKIVYAQWKDGQVKSQTIVDHE